MKNYSTAINALIIDTRTKSIHAVCYYLYIKMMMIGGIKNYSDFHFALCIFLGVVSRFLVTGCPRLIQVIYLRCQCGYLAVLENRNPGNTLTGSQTRIITHTPSPIHVQISAAETTIQVRINFGSVTKLCPSETICFLDFSKTNKDFCVKLCIQVNRINSEAYAKFDSKI